MSKRWLPFVRLDTAGLVKLDLSETEKDEIAARLGKEILIVEEDRLNRRTATIDRWLAVFGLAAWRDGKQAGDIDVGIDACLEQAGFIPADASRLRTLLAFTILHLADLADEYAHVPRYREVAETFVRLASHCWNQGLVCADIILPVAECLADYLRNPKCYFGSVDDIHELVDKLDDRDGLCGLRSWATPTVRGRAREVAVNDFFKPGFVLKNRKKLEDIAANFSESEAGEDWSALCRRFPKETSEPTIDSGDFFRAAYHRGEMPSGFRLHFYLYCWKYCMFGISDGKPVPALPFARQNPFGTEIFIPANMSVDFRRDLDLGKIAALHRDADPKRRSRSEVEAHQASGERNARVATADAEARAKGLKGDARYDYVRKTAKLAPDTDEAHIRRMIKAAKSGDSDRSQGKS